MSVIWPQIPREPRQGEQPAAVTIIQIIRCLRYILPRLQPESRPSRRGSSIILPPAALTLVFDAPPGYVPPDGATGTPVFMTWGVFGTVIKETLFSNPMLTVGADTTSTTYVWAKCSIDVGQPFLVSDVSWVFSDDPAAHPTAAFGDDGTPPTEVYIPMGKITAVAGAVTLQSSGTGSVVIALYNTGEQYNDNGATLNVSRAIGYWRTGSANE